MTKTTDTIYEVGCYLNSSRGHYLSADIIEFALKQGMPDRIDDTKTFSWMVKEYNTNPDSGISEWIHEDADKAIEWLNDNCTNGSSNIWFVDDGELYYNSRELYG